MRKHKGAHPRMGATDVCPFIPVSNVTWEKAIACANQLAKRVADELNIPVYLYEKAARNSSRSNLAVIRAGEYEGFFEKIKEPAWKPDFGPAVFNEKSGATAIGVRDFLVAYNVNLNTKAVRRANSDAFDVRENGRIKTDDGTPYGKPVLDAGNDEVGLPRMGGDAEAQPRRSLGRRRLVELDERRQHAVERDRRMLVAAQLGVEARGVGNVGDQPVQPLDVLDDDRHQPGPLLRLEVRPRRYLDRGP